MQRTEETDTMTLTFGKKRKITCNMFPEHCDNWFCLQFRPGPLGAPVYYDAAVSLLGSHSD